MFLLHKILWWRHEARLVHHDGYGERNVWGWKEEHQTLREVEFREGREAVAFRQIVGNGEPTSYWKYELGKDAWFGDTAPCCQRSLIQVSSWRRGKQS